jgi:hypothetical protein
MSQTSKSSLPAVDRCAGDCNFAEYSNHAHLLTIQDDAIVLAGFISGINGYYECTHDGEMAPFQPEDFVREHNWPRPLEAGYLAEAVGAFFAALYKGPGGKLERDLVDQ